MAGLLRILLLSGTLCFTLLILWKFNAAYLVSVSQQQRNFDQVVGHFELLRYSPEAHPERTPIHLALSIHGDNPPEEFTLTTDRSEPNALAFHQLLRLMQLASEANIFNSGDDASKNALVSFAFSIDDKTFRGALSQKELQNNIVAQHLVALARAYNSPYSPGAEQLNSEDTKGAPNNSNEVKNDSE